MGSHSLNQHQSLTRYEAARFALAEAHRIDEVKDIRDKAIAMQEYAKQAKDTEMLQHATEIRLRAERRAGELLKDLGERRGGDHRSNSSGDEFDLPSNKKLGITDNQSSKWQKLAALEDDKFEIRVEHAKARVENMTTSAPEAYTRQIYTGENEWFTPPRYIEMARTVMGGIDLDPASHVLAQKTVQSTTFFTAQDNGLSQDWFGRIWLNPPYSKATMEPFIMKLLKELENGRVSQAILLTHNYTDTGWFHAAAQACAEFCLPRGRIAFQAPSGDEATSPVHGQVFFYFGQDSHRFRQMFGEIGLIARLA
jgi:ParB family chromosome partitioning protein